MASSEGATDVIKSKSSREQSFVRFINRTSKPVDIIWKSFKGENIRYVSGLPPQRHFSVSTFVSHPWQAWSSDTLSVLNIGGGPVFYPSKWNEQDGWTAIYIDEPVHALVRLCLEKIKSLVDLEDSDQLDIPKILVQELKKRRSVNVQDYNKRR